MTNETMNAPYEQQQTFDSNGFQIRPSVVKPPKKRRAGRFVRNLIIYIIIFCLGFASGYMYDKSEDKNGPDVSSASSSQEQTEGSDASEQTPSKEPKKTVSKEGEMLNKLKNDLITVVKTKHPSVDLSFAIKNLDTGEYVEYDNKMMNSASIIKLFILETVYKSVADGTYVLTPEKEKELELMITESKNTAANMFIDDFGGQNEKRKVEETNKINVTIARSGYKNTELNRKMHDTTPPEGPSGYQNYSSVADVTKFLEGIYDKSLLGEPYSTRAMEYLKSQTRRGKIPAKIQTQYPGVVVANKTGELSQVENDAAIIIGPDFNIVFVVMIDQIPLMAGGATDYGLKQKVQETISELGLRVVEFYTNNKF